MGGTFIEQIHKKKNNCLLSIDPDKNKEEGKQVIKKGDNYQNAIDLWQWSKCPKDPNAVKYATTHKTTQRAFKKVHLQTRVHSEGERWKGWGGSRGMQRADRAEAMGTS